MWNFMLFSVRLQCDPFDTRQGYFAPEPQKRTFRRNAFCLATALSVTVVSENVQLSLVFNKVSQLLRTLTAYLQEQSIESQAIFMNLPQSIFERFKGTISIHFVLHLLAETDQASLWKGRTAICLANMGNIHFKLYKQRGQFQTLPFHFC